VYTPLDANFKLSAALSPQSEESVQCVPYSSAIKSIKYTKICTCPNISHKIIIVDCHMANFGKVHRQAVK
jgi:hypothetical protein